MNAAPKTIQIFLPSGDPQGIRVAEITTRIVQAIEVPRSLLQKFAAMDESRQVGVYFLFGQIDEDSDQSVYIGQTGNLAARLNGHNKNKDFWDRAIVTISRTNSLTQTHALFLEWYCLKACREAGRYPDENGNSGSKPHTPPPLEADCLEIFETTRTLLATLGYPIFDPVVSGDSGADEEKVFYCKASGTNGSGLYTPEGFVVLKGSVGRRKNSPSMKGTAAERRREKLLTTGVLVEDGDRVVFQKDHLFKSPSMAALALTGRSTNGWTNWRDKDGTTLDELKRQGDVETEDSVESP